MKLIVNHRAELKDIAKNGLQKCFNDHYKRWQECVVAQRSYFERGRVSHSNLIARVSGLLSRSSLIWTVRSCWDQVDRRDVIYTVARLRMPLTDKLSKRPSHHKTRTRRTNDLIGCFFSAAGSTFTTSPCVFQNHRKVPGSRTFGIGAPIMCAVNDTIPDASVLSGVMHDEIGLQRNEARSFSETNLDSV
ncbi:hypothetical protein TNCV_445351 [Trichonephila clavipes]|nr:hypothetical protein TNCV_445351 [Trichonephila clavipes]